MGAHQTNGKDIDFWLGGNTIFGVSIFVANMILATHSKTFDWRYIFLLILGPISYFLFYWVGNIILINEIWHLFSNNFSMPGWSMAHGHGRMPWRRDHRAPTFFDFTCEPFTLSTGCRLDKVCLHLTAVFGRRGRCRTLLGLWSFGFWRRGASI